MARIPSNDAAVNVETKPTAKPTIKPTAKPGASAAPRARAEAKERGKPKRAVNAVFRDADAMIAGSALSSASAARRPGRPTGAARGPEQRARLLDAALTLFAKRGIVDTSLGEIAREAGFTPAMMHYYFKTRDQLLDVLIDERFAPLRASLGVPFQEHPDDPVAAITQLTQRLVQVASDNPWFASLWVREVMSDSGLLRQRMHERFGNTNQKASLSAIERWQKEGRLNPALEPSLVFVTLLGMTILPLAASKLWCNDPVRRKLGAEEIARHAVALLVHGIGAKDTA